MGFSVSFERMSTLKALKSTDILKREKFGSFRYISDKIPIVESAVPFPHCTRDQKSQSFDVRAQAFLDPHLPFFDGLVPAVKMRQADVDELHLFSCQKTQQQVGIWSEDALDRWLELQCLPNVPVLRSERDREASLLRTSYQI